MNKILICICVFSLLTLFALCLLIKNYKNKKINHFDKKVKRVVNTISFIGTAFAILALIISSFGLIIQSKSPKLQMEIYTAHEVTWEEDNGSQELCLSYDDDGHVDYSFGVPSYWHLHIKNEGNQYAENVKVQIRFDDFAFVSQPDSFTLSDHNYAVGSYCAVEHTFDEIIQPGETIEVPYIPFDKAELYQDNPSNYTNMNIKIYENSSLVLEKDIFIEINNEDSCLLEINANDENKLVRKLNKYYFDHEDYFSVYNYDLSSMELYPPKSAFSLEKHEEVYKYYLELVNVYNPVLADVYSRLALFYGRLYYMDLSKEVSGIDVEKAIENDMAIQWKSRED